ncbi:hypothetical protein HMPREF9418_2668 [Neisseria macacae ATCC 33926]|uniref:Uncharacterized protein n=1 Tax=Neisseria macacae ATCC 33926 TaxID=997348 RepID=A0AA36UGI2_9NEIS|nr:hypothetical protein HMPREF9418_2668 [Neisseria macacae ATCC 33926]
MIHHAASQMLYKQLNKATAIKKVVRKLKSYYSDDPSFISNL